jgi:hypothetical protein
MKVGWAVLVGAVALWTQAAGAQTLQEQAMCAAQAAMAYQRDKAETAKSVSFAGYEDHYNPLLNRCFILEHELASGSDIMIITILLDAFEGHILALYTSVNGRLFECELTPTHRTTYCKSAAEFNAFVQKYMGAVFGGAE